MTQISTDFIWLKDEQALMQACEHWQTCDALFIDTEFVRRTTFFPQLGLVQIADDQHNYLLDPIAIDDLSPLGEILENPSILKVMHASSEDIDVFYSIFGSTPVPLFDTQIAAGIAGLDAGLGFARLVEQVCDVSLDKAETTSDWLKRPLSDRQCEYACADVAYLKPCYFYLKEKLNTLERYDWVLEDSQHMINNHVCLQPASELYKRMKGIGRLNRQQLAICQSLCAWRDTESRNLDRPKSRVIKDADIILLAKKQPQVIEQFPTDVFFHGWLKRFAKPTLAAIAEAQKLDENAYPKPSVETLNSTKAMLSRLRAKANAVAAEQSIADTVLASKKDLLALMESLRCYQEPNPEMSGWRWSVIGSSLVDLCREYS